MKRRPRVSALVVSSVLGASSPVTPDGEENGGVFVTCLNVVRKWEADNPTKLRSFLLQKPCLSCSATLWE